MKPLEFIGGTWQLLQVILEEAAPELEAIGLYPRALFLLCRIDEFPYPAKLAEALLVPAPTVSFILRQFEKQGLISRQIESDDLRRFRLSLTKKGETALTKAREIMDAHAGKRLSRLTADQLVMLDQLFNILSQREGSSGDAEK